MLVHSAVSVLPHRINHHHSTASVDYSQHTAVRGKAPNIYLDNIQDIRKGGKGARRATIAYIMATQQQQQQQQQQPLWKCVCSHLNKTSKRCSNCKRWRGGSRPHKITTAGENANNNAEMTASHQKRAMQRHLLDRGRCAVGESTVVEEGDAGNEECRGNEDITVSFERWFCVCQMICERWFLCLSIIRDGCYNLCF